MSRLSVVMMPDTGELWNAVGDPVRADGWFGIPSGLHTISIQVRNLQGRVYIEGTLAVKPTELDWFAISLRDQLPYIEYPLDPMDPTGLFGGDTGITAYNISGNFMFLRARLDRSYIFPDAPDPFAQANYGKVVLILLNQ
jgi:hypothetical protein